MSEEQTPIEKLWIALAKLNIPELDHMNLTIRTKGYNIRLYTDLLSVACGYTKYVNSTNIRFVICGDVKRTAKELGRNGIYGYTYTLNEHHPFEEYFMSKMKLISSTRWDYDAYGQIIHKDNSVFEYNISIEYLLPTETVSNIHPDWFYELIYYDFTTKTIVIPPNDSTKTIKVTDLDTLENLVRCMKNTNINRSISYSYLPTQPKLDTSQSDFWENIEKKNLE